MKLDFILRQTSSKPNWEMWVVEWLDARGLGRSAAGRSRMEALGKMLEQLAADPTLPDVTLVTVQSEECPECGGGLFECDSCKSRWCPNHAPSPFSCPRCKAP